MPRLQREAKGRGFGMLCVLLQVLAHRDRHRNRLAIAANKTHRIPSAVPLPRAVVVRALGREEQSVRMATDGNAAPAAKPEGKPEDKKRVKDETIAKAAGAVIAGGIIWSLFKSVTGRGKRQQEKDTLSKDIQHTAEHAGKEIEHKAKGVAHGAEHKEIDFKHSIEAAGSKISHFGHKKLDGKTVRVHKGDTLWGIARKYNVTVEALMATNGIKNGDSISAGESIVVPKSCY